MKFYFLLAIANLATTAALAQLPEKDFVVTTAGDTLHGRILISKKGAGKVKLQRQGMPATTFGPTEAHSYGDAAGIIGVSQLVGPHSSPQFVVPLVLGPVSLYVGRNQLDEKRYFLQAPDTTYLIEISRPTAQLTFHRLLAGCSSLEFGTTTAQQRYQINFTDLTRLVMKYNACTQPQRPSTLIKSAVSTRVVYGIKGGISSSDFALSFDAYPTNQKRVLGYQGGVFVRATNKTHLSLQMEALYAFLRNTYGPAISGSGLYARTVSIQYAQLQLPILFRYTGGNGVVRPFLNGGFVAGINFSNRSAELSQSLSSSTITNQRVPISTLDNTGWGWTVGAGTSIRRGDLPEIGLELRYDRMRYGNYVYFTPKHTSLRFDVSIGF